MKRGGDREIRDIKSKEDNRLLFLIIIYNYIYITELFISLLYFYISVVVQKYSFFDIGFNFTSSQYIDFCNLFNNFINTIVYEKINILLYIIKSHVFIYIKYTIVNVKLPNKPQKFHSLTLS